MTLVVGTDYKSALSDIILNSTYKLTVVTKLYIKDIVGIHVHLETEFDKIHPGFKNYFKVFFFNEEGGEMLTDTATGITSYQGYNGAARTNNCKEVVLYNTPPAVASVSLVLTTNSYQSLK